MRLDDIGITREETKLTKVLPNGGHIVERGRGIRGPSQDAEVGDAPRGLEGEPGVAQRVRRRKQEHQAAGLAGPPRRDVEVEDGADLAGRHLRLAGPPRAHLARPRRVHAHQRVRELELAGQVGGAASGGRDGRRRRRAWRPAVVLAVLAVVFVAADMARLWRRAFRDGRGRCSR